MPARMLRFACLFGAAALASLNSGAANACCWGCGCYGYYPCYYTYSPGYYYPQNYAYGQGGYGGYGYGQQNVGDPSRQTYTPWAWNGKNWTCAWVYKANPDDVDYKVQTCVVDPAQPNKVYFHNGDKYWGCCDLAEQKYHPVKGERVTDTSNAGTALDVGYDNMPIIPDAKDQVSIKVPPPVR